MFSRFVTKVAPRCNSIRNYASQSSFMVNNTTTFPSQHFDKYRTEPSTVDPEGRGYTYMVVGGAATGLAAMAKNTVVSALSTMAPGQDILALSSIEIDLSSIPEATAVTLKWRGKPLFIRHRSSEEIESSKEVDVTSLPDPEADDKRAKVPEWVVLVGVCTHLGCIPIAGGGDFGGWYCPCHGSHYDNAGRIRKGPAPQNLIIPPYKFLSSEHIIVGDE
ncbi:ubiquinol-cytochrome-c reductase subunit [Heterostelium album PN500]|uniref:Cytochrome b-c1 complex subunit Rieske, mitochondrial n=1 Tax=Heterostelium pallidum (strain ATCC 26659 / Pp 5 / PN500) TaxID=670386 RepID=D3BHJ9_HETP5|nr:ubiquinol-cytochrome-c reductase subunit [Heterostelium album PN500]EFA79176.1 ubiquinol-cytochrome-c reductase subunit [Heterostelium album PN500]|eukprot:XP_020431297.1 ubiquinol-cytochrome-c reductase subunit [Heterostelium album PN500]